MVREKEVPLEIASWLDSVGRSWVAAANGLAEELCVRRSRKAHVLGFASNDGRGLAGIELIDNRDLAGRDGEQFMQRDGRGALRPDVDYAEVPAADGENLTLTIDEAIQSAAETALKVGGVENAGAEAGIAIVDAAFDRRNSRACERAGFRSQRIQQSHERYAPQPRHHRCV